MNEEQKTQELDNLELLKTIIPSWKLARPEPFIKPPSESVVQPEWNKVAIPVRTGTSGGGVPPSNFGSQRVICARQQGDTFVPSIMIPSADTLFEDA